MSNAGPLIALAQIGHLNLLEDLFGGVSIPVAVHHEITVAGAGLAGSDDVRSAHWIEVIDVGDRTAVELLRERLDLGESEAVVLSIEQGAQLLMDESRGRRIAEAKGLAVMGTIGVMLAGKRRGFLKSVTPMLEILVASGFRMSEGVYRTAQILADEA